VNRAPFPAGMLDLCVEVLAEHQDDGTGTCAGCGHRLASCSARRNCINVLRRAGYNPAKFDSAALLGETAYIRPAMRFEM
jgi:polyferredoxin